MKDKAAIEIMYEECDSKKCIAVEEGGQKNGEVKINPGGMIEFTNTLDTTAEVQFFLRDAKVPGGALNIFCKNQKTGKLEIASGKTGKCKLVKYPGNFEYEVAATGYETLDPVIIIEKSTTLNFVAVGGVILLVAIAFLAGRASRAK